jgi:hypothetical protein
MYADCMKLIRGSHSICFPRVADPCFRLFKFGLHVYVTCYNLKAEFLCSSVNCLNTLHMFQSTYLSTPDLTLASFQRVHYKHQNNVTFVRNISTYLIPNHSVYLHICSCSPCAVPVTLIQNRHTYNRHPQSAMTLKWTSKCLMVVCFSFHGYHYDQCRTDSN